MIEATHSEASLAMRAATRPQSLLSRTRLWASGFLSREEQHALEDAVSPAKSVELTFNAPTGRVLTRAQFLAMMRDGRIGVEDFDRTIESVTVDGDVGVVMGREVFTPTPQSELGRTYGAVPLDRRYTNVYRRESGKWRWFARHANVVAKKAVDVR